MPEPTVYIVDDDDAVRKVLRWLITSVGLPVAEYKSADDFLAAFEPGAMGCLLLDVRMPGMSGLELQRRILKDGDGLPIVFLTGHADVPMAIEAMKNGAFDFIEKPFNNQNLLDIVQKGITQSLRIRDGRTENQNRELKLSALTTRERQVYELVVAGKTNKSAAQHLGITQKTIEVHRSRMMAKLEAHSLSDLISLSKGDV